MPSYDYWATYLAKARNGHDRPINGSSTKRVIWGPDKQSIMLRYHWTDCVILFPNGTAIINTGGWHTVTTKRFINEYAPVSLWSEKGQLFVRMHNPTITPEKIQKCRTCHGEGKVPNHCYPRHCWPPYGGACEHGETTGHRRTCAHGLDRMHPDGLTECQRCDDGRRDYGSKIVHYKWDGDPLAIDDTGEPLGNPNVVPAAHLAPKAYAPAPKADRGYSDSGSLLERVLPGLSDDAACPVDECETTGTVQTVVIHMNDSERWTRLQIADWLDTLDVDLSFPVPDRIPAHIN